MADAAQFLTSDYRSFDPVRFGRRMKAARIMAGYEDMRLYCGTLRRHGILPNATLGEMAARMMQVESGLWVPSYPLVATTAAITCPPGGRNFFEEAFDGDTQRELDMLRRMES